MILHQLRFNNKCTETHIFEHSIQWRVQRGQAGTILLEAEIVRAKGHGLAYSVKLWETW